MGRYVRDNFLMAFKAGSPSMVPRIWQGDQVMGDRYAYRDQDPALGDIVIFRNPARRSVRQRPDRGDGGKRHLPLLVDPAVRSPPVKAPPGL
jgi:hypothetical protein